MIPSNKWIFLIWFKITKLDLPIDTTLSFMTLSNYTYDGAETVTQKIDFFIKNQTMYCETILLKSLLISN